MNKNITATRTHGEWVEWENTTEMDMYDLTMSIPKYPVKREELTAYSTLCVQMHRADQQLTNHLLPVSFIEN